MSSAGERLASRRAHLKRSAGRYAAAEATFTMRRGPGAAFNRGQKGGHHVYDAKDIDIVNPSPLRRVCLQKAAEKPHTGIVHQDIGYDALIIESCAACGNGGLAAEFSANHAYRMGGMNAARCHWLMVPSKALRHSLSIRQILTQLEIANQKERLVTENQEDRKRLGHRI